MSIQLITFMQRQGENTYSRDSPPQLLQTRPFSFHRQWSSLTEFLACRRHCVYSQSSKPSNRQWRALYQIVKAVTKSYQDETSRKPDEMFHQNNTPAHMFLLSISVVIFFFCGEELIDQSLYFPYLTMICFITWKNTFLGIFIAVIYCWWLFLQTRWTDFFKESV